jgi:hypothetical protein
MFEWRPPERRIAGTFCAGIDVSFGAAMWTACTAFLNGGFQWLRRNMGQYCERKCGADKAAR